MDILSIAICYRMSDRETIRSVIATKKRPAVEGYIVRIGPACWNERSLDLGTNAVLRWWGTPTAWLALDIDTCRCMFGKLATPYKTQPNEQTQPY